MITKKYENGNKPIKSYTMDRQKKNIQRKMSRFTYDNER